MDNITTTAQQLTDQARRFSSFTGVARSNPQDRFFLVMGKTGSGKSTFIARCTGHNVTVGHGLYSCTSSIDTYSYTLPYHRGTRTIHLIDTPGFNDTNRSDIETLGVLASYLGASYANGVRIHGIILLHPITDNRMSGSSVRNVDMMEKMCGFSSYENVVIATTMWDSKGQGQGQGAHGRGELERREMELRSERRFLGNLVAKGAVMFRHGDSGGRRGLSSAEVETRSARRIVAHLIAQSDAVGFTPKVLRLQREIIDEGKTLGKTEAGRAVAGELYEARKEHERQLRDLEREMKGRLARADASHAAELRGLKTDIQRKLAKAEKDKRALERSMQDMHKDEGRAWKAKIDELDQQFRKQIAEKEEELEELEDSIREIQGDASHSRVSMKADKEVSEHEAIVRNARREVVEARDAHANLRDHIANGLANGVAASVTTGVMTAAMSGALVCVVM